ncbi:hypothetical protein Tcan_04718 [Toxocara canis]|uniref:Uncharacterized protein n=1 Tax=Toxocara canis TaxID=6265 RepID=A0A0B2VEM3_TOXCA|nr:hypothetical protein Tcan_04718 [Toxocara canis]
MFDCECCAKPPNKNPYTLTTTIDYHHHHHQTSSYTRKNDTRASPRSLIRPSKNFLVIKILVIIGFKRLIRYLVFEHFLCIIRVLFLVPCCNLYQYSQASKNCSIY